MAKKIKLLATLFTVSTILLFFIYSNSKNPFWLSSTITAGTFSYHFLMRLCVGWIIDLIMHNRANLDNPWYQLHKFETKLYTWLKIKKWKRKMPTYSPELFDASKRSYAEIAQSMCQAEIVHECIMILSFLPVLLVPLFGAFWVFFLTSTAAAFYDSIFVMIQRYNRPRIIKLMYKKIESNS